MLHFEFDINESMEKTKNTLKQSHLFSSFGIAVIAHLAVIVLAVQFNEKNPYLTTFNPQNVIPVEFAGRDGGTKSTASTTVPMKKVAKKSGSLTGVAMNKVDAVKPSGLPADGTGNEIGRSGEVLESTGSTLKFDSQIVTFSEPVYPRIAQRRGYEGSVTIRLKVTPEGIPVEPKILKSSGHESLDQSALEAALKWRFQKRAKPDFALVDKTVVFKLNE